MARPERAARARDALEEFAECLRASGHEAILAELHRRFHERLNDVITGAAGQMPPGRERLMAGTLAYLDQCRRERGIQRLLAGTRGEPAVRAEVARRSDEFSRLAAPDFAAMGLLPPLQAARLWVIMATGIAAAESAAGAAQAQLRAALVAYLPE